MKYLSLILLSLTMFGCAQTSVKRAAEIVPTCFSDGENQELYCKAQRTDDEGRTVITRCIGKDNREALPNLRGKCVEKICSEGSNTDCSTRGEFAVLQQYAELMTSGQFGTDDAGPAPAPTSKKMTAMKEKGKLKGKAARAVATAAPASAAAASVTMASTEIDTDPTAKLAALPTPTPEPSPSPKKVIPQTTETEPQPMSITLKPAKASKKKARASASVKAEDGFKKVCIEKGDTSAPEILRGKCATRNCASGKCTYKGRKEMFEWVMKSASAH